VSTALLEPPAQSVLMQPTSTRTTCPYCAVQCSFDIAIQTGAAIAMKPTKDCPVAGGSVCKKGLNALELVNHPERLLTPLVRKNGILEPATWEEALTRVVDGMKSVRAAHGSNAYGVFGGGSLSNEHVYLLSKFARVAMQTANIDYNGRFCMSTAAAAMRAVYGMDRGLPFPLEKLIEKDCIVLWGANLAETLPPVSQYILRARKAGAPIIVIDPRPTRTSSLATHYLPVKPGGDLALALAMLHVIIDEARERWAFLEKRTVGWEKVMKSVVDCTPEWASEKCGLEAKVIRDTARLMARAVSAPDAKFGGLVILSGRGPEQQSKGVDTIKALINLALSLGGIYAPLTGQGNGQGGREHGQKADQLPGYRSILDPLARGYFAAHWGIDEDDLPGKGLSAQELLEACGSSVKGLFVIGSNVVVSAPDAGKLEERLQKLEHLVVVDFFLSETAALAEVVLPGSMWLETDGTMTNLEGRVLRRRKVQDTPGEAREDWKILCEIGSRLGHPGKFLYQNVEEIFEDFVVSTRGAPADYSGLTYEKIGTKGVFWPCPHPNHPGTPEPFAKFFAHQDGRAHLAVVKYRDSAEMPNLDYPLFLTTGRDVNHYQSGTQTRRSSLNAKSPHALAQMHPSLAAQHNLENGAAIQLETKRGVGDFKVLYDEKMRADTVFVSFHYAGSEAINRLTSAALDPVSRMPEFKVCAAKIVAPV
jgi:assimilatory nitrate reductase catalytic subunit